MLRRGDSTGEAGAAVAALATATASVVALTV